MENPSFLVTYVVRKVKSGSGAQLHQGDVLPLLLMGKYLQKQVGFTLYAVATFMSKTVAIF